MSNPPPDEFKLPYRVYTVDEVCRILRLSKRTVLEKIRTGQLRATKTGRAWRVTQDGIDEYFGLPSSRLASS